MADKHDKAVTRKQTVSMQWLGDIPVILPSSTHGQNAKKNHVP